MSVVLVTTPSKFKEHTAGREIAVFPALRYGMVVAGKLPHFGVGIFPGDAPAPTIAFKVREWV